MNIGQGVYTRKSADAINGVFLRNSDAEQYIPVAPSVLKESCKPQTRGKSAVELTDILVDLSAHIGFGRTPAAGRLGQPRGRANIHRTCHARVLIEYELQASVG